MDYSKLRPRCNRFLQKFRRTANALAWRLAGGREKRKKHRPETPNGGTGKPGGKQSANSAAPKEKAPRAPREHPRPARRSPSRFSARRVPSRGVQGNQESD